MKEKNPLSQELLTGMFRTSPKDEYRIINREGSTIEFKESYNHGSMSTYFKTIAAFANNNGGYLLFGVGDRPRKLLGLVDKSLEQFEDLKVEVLTNGLLDYFSPEIKWDHCTFIFKGMSFGVIYVFPLARKPCICKKNHDQKNQKHSLKEGDIYYRYGGRSEKIKYSELANIIEESRRNEEKMWLDFAKKAAKIGVANASLLDLTTGKLSSSGNSIFISEELLHEIKFIQEGKFVEKEGSPTLRLIGNIKSVDTGKVVIKETTKKVVRGIEPDDIVKCFFNSETVDEPLEYIKRICSCTTSNYPLYFYIKQTNMTTTQVMDIVNNLNSRGSVKQQLLNRLNGKLIDRKTIPATSTTASKEKLIFKDLWLNNNIPNEISNITYCLQALLYLSDKEIITNATYIKQILSLIFENNYEKASGPLANDIRKAICRVDEALYLQ